MLITYIGKWRRTDSRYCNDILVQDVFPDTASVGKLLRAQSPFLRLH
jgi:hypothetical protein